MDLEVVAERASELADGVDETELVERGRPQVADDALHLDDERVDLVGDAVEQFA